MGLRFCRLFPKRAYLCAVFICSLARTIPMFTCLPKARLQVGPGHVSHLRHYFNGAETRNYIATWLIVYHAFKIRVAQFSPITNYRIRLVCVLTDKTILFNNVFMDKILLVTICILTKEVTMHILSLYSNF